MKRETAETIVALGMLATLLAFLALFAHSCHKVAPPAPVIVQDEPPPTHVDPQPTPAPMPAPKPTPIETFETAAKQAATNRQPGVALLTADWCGPCKRFERDILPGLLQDCVFDPPYFCLVDIDSQKDVADNLFQKDRHIPQLVKFDASIDGETITVKSVDRLVGPKSEAQVKAFLTAKPPAACVPAATSDATITDQPSAGLLHRLFHRS